MKTESRLAVRNVISGNGAEVHGCVAKRMKRHVGSFLRTCYGEVQQDGTETIQVNRNGALFQSEFVTIQDPNKRLRN